MRVCWVGRRAIRAALGADPCHPSPSYRRLFALAGPLYVLVAFLGRLPAGDEPARHALLVSGATGSYGAGWRVSAGALAVANAVGAPVAGILADRVGQRRVVLVQSLAGAAGLVTLVSLVHRGYAVAGPGRRGRGHRPGAAPGRAPGPGPLEADHPGRGPRPASPRRRGVLLRGRRRRGVVRPRARPSSAASRPWWPPARRLLVAAVVLAVFGSLFAVHESAELTRRLHGAQQLVAGRLLTPTLTILAVAQLAIGVVSAPSRPRPRCWPPQPACPG